MNPSAMEDLWVVVRCAAEGSDWKRDEGESLHQWVARKLNGQLDLRLVEAVRLLRRCSSPAYDNRQGRQDAGQWLLEHFPINRTELPQGPLDKEKS